MTQEAESTIYFELGCHSAVSDGSVHNKPVRIQQIPGLAKHPGVELALWGYPALADELKELRQELLQYRAKAPYCVQDTLEAEMLYIRVRSVKPKLV